MHLFLDYGMDIGVTDCTSQFVGFGSMAEVGLLPDDSDGTKQMFGCMVQGQDENSTRQLVEAAEELEEAVKTEYRDGMEILVQDDYADDITYSRVLQILDTYQITYGEEKL